MAHPDSSKQDLRFRVSSASLGPWCLLTPKAWPTMASKLGGTYKWIKQLWHDETSLVVSSLLIALFLLAFGLIADQVLGGSTAAFDRAVILVFREAGPSSAPIGPPWLEGMARDITALGSFVVLGIVLFAVAGYLFVARKRAVALLVIVAVLGGATLNSLLKLAFARPRPDFVAPSVKVFTGSFPSGHAALSAVTYLTLAALLARTTSSRPLRVYFITVGITLTLLVGISRVYLGVHYPTDVLAGWCIGSAWALGCWLIVTRLQQDGSVEPPQK
jgi:undecaprenyl-diphosphatase